MATKGVTPATKVKGDISQIGLQVGNLCKTTGWYNNCGLNSLTHFLFAKLSAMSEGELDVFLAQNPEYFFLLNSFHEYYGLQAHYGWQDILRLLREHPVATDQEAIFAPVLRLHLGKILVEHADDLWMTDASSAVSDYIKSGEIRDIARPVYQANKPFFDELQAQFEAVLIASLQSENPSVEEFATANSALRNHRDHLAIPDYQPTQEEILQHIIFQRRNSLEGTFLPQAKQYWIETGCQRYAEYVANMNHQVMISADHLQFICQKLNIGLEVYTPGSIQRALDDRELAAHTRGAQWVPEEGAFMWLMKVLNMGIHWIYQEPSNDAAKVAAHNQHYPEALDAVFLENHALSGRFKIIGPLAMNKELIIAEIKHRLGEISVEELAELRNAVAVAESIRLAALAKAREAAVKAPVKHACGLFTETHTVLDATDMGKKYIALLTADPDVLQVFNQEFQSSSFVKPFLDAYGNDKNLLSICSLNKESKIAFLKALAAKLKSKMPAPVVTPASCHTMARSSTSTSSSTSTLSSSSSASSSGHPMQEALTVPSARLLHRAEATARLKLTHLAILTDKALLNGNAQAAEIAVKAFEANQEVADAFNAYSLECVRKFATNPKLPDLIPKFVKLTKEQQVRFLQRYAQSQAQQVASLHSTLTM